jgi:peptide/nickel transport system permease protein
LFFYILRRLIHLIPTFIGATLLAFFISQLVPGDYLTRLALNPDVRPETIENMRRNFGLALPWYQQYLRWMGNLLRGDLGLSFDSNQPVTNIIRIPILNSMILVVLSLIMLYLMAIPMGVMSARRQYSLLDQGISVVSYMGLAIPNFFFALVIILLLFGLRTFTRETFGFNELIFPVAKMTSSTFEDMNRWRQFWDIMWHAFIPSLVVATSGIAGFTRVLRAQMIEYLSNDFIRTAKAKGLSENTVTYKHALRPALIPFVAGIGSLLPGLISGAGLVEVVFAWPGITPRLLDAIGKQDIYVVLAFLIISTLLLVIGNLISDLLLAVVDPRIRYN